MKRLKNYALKVFSQRAKTMSHPLQQNHDPKMWEKHRFGLPNNRWERLKDKCVWVTGAGTGYGQCTAIALAAAGSFVILSGRKSEKLIETITLMKSYGIGSSNCEIVDFDLTDIKQTENACKSVMEITPSLYGLVNNAAVAQHGNTLYPLQEGTYEVWDKILKTNLTAQWYLTKTILPHMIKGKELRIIFMGSEAGWAFTPGFGMYNVSKCALNNLSASFASELDASHKDVDIQVNTIVPGEAKTEMNQMSTDSPFTIVPMALLLLSHPAYGPNGCFFHRDGRYFSFAYAQPYSREILC
ncbi:MAG: SDR family oxidoreductase [Nitrospirae bacterium]|nr:SDR family oxidoreductase [Nitrospirota bacterium]